MPVLWIETMKRRAFVIISRNRWVAEIDLRVLNLSMVKVAGRWSLFLLWIDSKFFWSNKFTALFLPWFRIIHVTNDSLEIMVSLRIVHFSCKGSRNVWDCYNKFTIIKSNTKTTFVKHSVELLLTTMITVKPLQSPKTHFGSPNNMLMLV